MTIATITKNETALAVLNQWHNGNMGNSDTVTAIIALALPAQETAAIIAGIFSRDSVTVKTGGFAELENKRGKITENAKKSAYILNSATSVNTLKALARDGKGEIGKRAKNAILGDAKGLDFYRNLNTIDGRTAHWGELLTLLVGEYGVGTFNRESMRGKAGCIKYLEVTFKAFELKLENAIYTKGQERAEVNLAKVQTDLAIVNRLFEISEAEKAEAMKKAEAEKARSEAEAMLENSEA